MRLQYLTLAHYSYILRLLRCFSALSLFASFIRNPRARRTPRGPSGCLHPDGPGRWPFDVAIPVAKLAKLSEFERRPNQ